MSTAAAAGGRDEGSWAEAPTPRPRELGQVWTPADVAERMAEMMLEALPEQSGPLRVLDPCVGPGTFLRPVIEQCDRAGLAVQIDAVEIDPALLSRTAETFAGSPTRFVGADYLLRPAAETYDAAILNPPYVRQELIPNERKAGYRARLAEAGQPRVSARSNLYSYFILKTMSELRAGGVMCAIVYSNLRTTRYGRELWAEVERAMEVLRTEHLLMPFEGAMIDAVVFVARKRVEPAAGGGASEAPAGRSGDPAVPGSAAPGSATPGLVHMGELVRVRRGTDLIDRKRFVVARASDAPEGRSIPLVLRTPPVGRLRVRPEAAVLTDADGHEFPVRRLKSGRVLFNYYIRNHPRHLWNDAGAAVSDNFLVIDPGDGPVRVTDEALWLLLNSSAVEAALLREATSQGSGLRKLQVYQYREAVVPDWRLLGGPALAEAHGRAVALIEADAGIDEVRRVADEVLGPLREESA